MTGETAPYDLLILEPAARGHGREWMLHLATHAIRQHPDLRLAFAAAAPVAERLNRDLAFHPIDAPRVVALSDQEAALCTHRNLAISGFARWLTMRHYLRRLDAREGLFLECDHLSLPLALGLPMGRGRSVSGVLFRPSVHYGTAIRPRWTERLRELRKNFLYRLMLRHPAVRQIHSLDDAFPAYARARYGGGAKVTALPDPVFPSEQPTVEDGALAAKAPKDRMLFVLFGVLAERKGVLALLRALSRFDAETSARAAIVIAGEIDPAIRDAVHGGIEVLNLDPTGPWVHLEERHLRAGEITALVDRSSVVLAPYQRFVGSSGVLMWAAGRGRPVITQDYGLLGRLVREHALGLAVDTTDPRALADAIAGVARQGATGLAAPMGMARFAAERRPEAFAAAILGPLALTPELAKQSQELKARGHRPFPGAVTD